MTPEEIAALATQAVEAALKTQRDADKAAADAAAADQARIDAAVETKIAALNAEAAKARRLPDNAQRTYGAGGNAFPYVTAFHDTRKYDGLDINDLSFVAEILTAAKKIGRSQGGVSRGALKALAIRIAEDQGDLGDEARNDLKAAGINPADVVNAAKANELDYSTQANYGDEWVGVEYSRRLWPAIRANTFVLQKLPSMVIPQGTESVTIPLESGDPTWYNVAQTTGTNATTGIPDSTVTPSKLGTASQSLTVSKIGARTVYSGEMEEDSLIPWAAQLRTQLEKSGAEQMEHLIIDGDTETGGTANINHIGGTPTTGTLFLALNGLRKLALVTNTANSRSAGGALADTDFLDTLKLMGTAGVNADPTKVEFIIDANVFWAVQKLLSVKTRDVFTQATLENGMFAGIWGYKVNASFFMHYLSATNARKANTAGKVNLTNQALNTTGAILAVRWDQWLLGYKRRVTIELERIASADATQIVALARMGLVARDSEASAISYNVAV